MRTISVFEDMEPTYAELSDALIKLGFEDKNTAESFRFYNKKHDLMILLPSKKLHQRLDAGRFGAISSQIEHFGIIRHIDDLGKMIKLRRLATETTLS
ncbi:MAG TPA: hypothetical protein ENJ95_08345 [Bacteroidetes bacterium]|nr:hypothetical protein [Bacteroidota bacterium]